MHGIISADYKAEGGKLLRVRLTIGEGQPCQIRDIKITGDFFMHPEEAIERLEAMLTDVPYTEEAVRAKVQAFFEQSPRVQVIGAGVEDFVHVIMAADAGGGGTRAS
jgi:lipoate-protein ligase A